MCIIVLSMFCGAVRVAVRVAVCVAVCVSVCDAVCVQAIAGCV